MNAAWSKPGPPNVSDCMDVATYGEEESLLTQEVMDVHGSAVGHARPVTSQSPGRGDEKPEIKGKGRAKGRKRKGEETQLM